MQNITFKQNQPERLDKFLANKLPTKSRSVWQKLIKQKLVLVNNKPVSPHHSLKNGDVIIIKEPPPLPTPEKKWQIPIIAQTNDFLVVDKPAGLVVHPAGGVKEKTLIEILVQKFPEIKTVGENENRPGLVHRLDKDVSGLLVIAKNNQMFFHLKKQFQERQVKKIYLGLLYGLIKPEQGEIDFKIDRSKKGKMVARPKGQSGKEALTTYQVIKYFHNFSYVKITLKTGRTHQIRVHFKAKGHPLVGDKLYRPRRLKTNLKIDRLFLHAHQLGFYDLEGEWQKFSSPLPSELKQLLKSLK